MIILSGGPNSVHVEGSPRVPEGFFEYCAEAAIPVLGICYGMQVRRDGCSGQHALSSRWAQRQLPVFEGGSGRWWVPLAGAGPGQQARAGVCVRAGVRAGGRSGKSSSAAVGEKLLKSLAAAEDQAGPAGLLPPLCSSLCTSWAAR